MNQLKIIKINFIRSIYEAKRKASLHEIPYAKQYQMDTCKIK